MSAVFTCSFARRTCAHEKLFHDAYQRCGASFHGNRDEPHEGHQGEDLSQYGTIVESFSEAQAADLCAWTLAILQILRCFPHCCPRHVDRSYCGSPVYLQVDLVHGDADPVDNDKLYVFAHFHPHAEDGFRLGEIVAREVFSSRNQQTDTNPEGEWIGSRLVASADRTTWMFEVNPSGRWFYHWESGATKAQRSTEHVFEVYLLMLQPTLYEYAVVAKASSAIFKVVSFRRAPTDKASGSPSDSTLRLPLLSAAWPSPGVHAFDEEEEKQSTPMAEHFHRESIDSATSTDTELASLTQTRSRIYDDDGSYSPSHDDEMEADCFTQLDLRPAEGPALAPLSLLPSPEVVMISTQLETLVELLQTLSTTALNAVLPYIESVLRPSGVTGSSIDGLTTPGLAALIVASSTRDPTRQDIPMPVYTALELALWILFDAEQGRIQEHWVQQASLGLLDKVALYESYYSWLKHFQQTVNVHLEENQSGAGLAGLAAVARRWLDAHGGSASLHVQECSGLEPFIAQTREVFLASSGIGSSTQAPRWTKRSRVSQTTISLPQAVSRASSTHGLRTFVGSWQADIPSIQRHPVASADVSPSAFVMLWSWRQLLVFSINTDPFVPTGTAPTYIVSSFWNASASKTRCSRLTVDGTPRWLRVFPSGESTSSVLLGSQRVDHYIASFRGDHNELLANFYTWPVVQDLDKTSCFCLRVSLRPQPASDGLSVRVSVERGRLRRGVDVATLGESSLALKLQAVDQWATQLSLEYACRRQHAAT